MNLSSIDLGSDASEQGSIESYEAYEPSIASTSLSSQPSIFSQSSSAQSSIASSVSDDFRYTQEDAREQDRACAQVQLNLSAQDQSSQDEAAIGRLLNHNTNGPILSYAAATSASIQNTHQNPRRCSQPRNQKPPPLVRQRDRKINFVENLVDSATQMIEVIWPLSGALCKAENSNGRGVLPLRTYIEETLRRSRTSYSTLQVALYYLILIRPHVPDRDFTKEQQLECTASRALMCGRRMFLAALILASKYLQDRNYSAKAWSRMSGLKICEINSNERVFLDKINWRLHIPKPIFEAWQEIVLRYTPYPPTAPQLAMGIKTSAWKAIIPKLTPELIGMPQRRNSDDWENCEAPALSDMNLPATPMAAQVSMCKPTSASTSQENTPTPSTMNQRSPERNPEPVLPLPPNLLMRPLPTPLQTPQLTSSSAISSTPAASACGSRRSSMCSAMALAQQACLSRCTVDLVDGPCSRRPFASSIASTGSSPESLISDRSSHYSRSSSVSSVMTASSVSSMAPPRASLAWSATCRAAAPRLSRPTDALKEASAEEDGSHARPIVIADDEMDLVASPEPADFSIADKPHYAPHRHSKHGPGNGSALSCGTAVTPVAAQQQQSRKRFRHHRPSHAHVAPSSRRSNLQEEVRYLLAETLAEDDHAEDSEGMDVDSDDAVDTVPSTPAVLRAGHGLAGSLMAKRMPQCPARGVALAYRRDCRVPMARLDGKKRTCLSVVEV